MKQTLLIIALLLALLNGTLRAQDRIARIELSLNELSLSTPGLKEKVELSVNGVSMQDFIRGLAISHKLNVSVDPQLDMKVVNNFSDVTVSEILVFVCRTYDLDITFTGPILSFSKYIPPVIVEVKESKKINLSYSETDDLLTFDLKNDSLSQVARELTILTKKNVVFAPDVSKKLVSGYLQNMPFINALDKLALVNDLKVTLTDDQVYILEKKEKPTITNNGSNPFTSTPRVEGLNIEMNGQQFSVSAKSVPIADIIAGISAQLHIDYFLFSELKGTATLNVSGLTYDDFLEHLLNGTEYTFKKKSNIYLFGERIIEGLRSTRLITLKNRTIDKVSELIPAELRKGVEIKAFPDLNGLIVSGSEPRINEIEKFIRQLDVVVPVVIIEVIIADVRNTKTLSTGIEAGLGKNPKSTGGTVYPGVDVTLGAGALNELIAGLNGFGVVNLGNVTPGFYLTIKALESQGVLKLRSTPQLATLNGNLATMSIGKTEYYLETTNSVVGTQNPQNITTQTYKSVNADLSISVTPVVSADEQITLEISVKQSNFTERISPSAPPGTISRDFKSLIRIKNGEMVVLGGLEENSMNDSGSGVPVLSRVPILKWFFSSRTKAKSENKLTIFIKATVLY